MTDGGHAAGHRLQSEMMTGHSPVDHMPTLATQNCSVCHGAQLLDTSCGTHKGAFCGSTTTAISHLQDASQLERLGSAGGHLLEAATPAAAKASRSAAQLRACLVPLGNLMCQPALCCWP
jgi:hypothetical protein